MGQTGVTARPEKTFEVKTAETGCMEFLERGNKILCTIYEAWMSAIQDPIGGPKRRRGRLKVFLAFNYYRWPVLALQIIFCRFLTHCVALRSEQL